MITCSEHAGCLVVFNEHSTCPVCQQMAFVNEFMSKLDDMEKDISEMKAQNEREMKDLTGEIIAFAGRART